jgi:hypothetical protein
MVGRTSPQQVIKDVGERGDTLRTRPESGAVEPCRSAVSVEFVAKPNQGTRVRSMLPAAISSTFDGVAGFAGCAVLASEHEERLVTVLTFWQGEQAASTISENARWVCRLLEPYMDHKLRVQTMRSHLAIVPAPAMVTAPPAGSFLGTCNTRVA